MGARWRHNMAPCTVECSVSVSNCVIYIIPFLLNYKYDDIVLPCCDQQHLYMLNMLLGGGVGWGGGGGGGGGEHTHGQTDTYRCQIIDRQSLSDRNWT